MSSNNVNAATALTNKLYQVLTGGNGVPQNTFISYATPGYAIDFNAMQWATKTPPYVGTADADNAAAFARVVNAIPNGAGNWAPSGADLARTYRDIFLQNMMVPSVPLNDQQTKELTDAQAYVDANYDNYQTYQTTWQQANMSLQIAIMAPRDASYFQNVLMARQAANTAMSDWQAKGHKAALETALSTVNHYTGLGLVNAKNNLEKDFDSVKSVNSTTTGTPFVPVGLFPSHVFTNTSPWNKFTINASEYSSFQHNVHSNYSSGSSNWLFWSWGSSNSGWSNSAFHDIDTSTLSVSFEFMRAHIDRSDWFDTFLLTSNSWWWPGATKSHPTFGGVTFSDGSPPGKNHGQWTMIPTDLLFTRNVVVHSTNYNFKSASWASGWQHSAASGFWIFSNSGSSSSGGSSGSSVQISQDGSSLTIPQPQIAALVCQLIPKEPNPSIALLPNS